MGVVEAYATANPAEGVAALTGKDADRFKFKVPTLRNVELTYPYFHDGAYWKLEEAVDVMARLQLGRKLADEEVVSITAFLKTLTGQQPSFCPADPAAVARRHTAAAALTDCPAADACVRRRARRAVRPARLPAP